MFRLFSDMQNKGVKFCTHEGFASVQRDTGVSLERIVAVTRKYTSLLMLLLKNQVWTKNVFRPWKIKLAWAIKFKDM